MRSEPLDRFPGRQSLFGPSPADKLLAGCYGAKIELLRYTVDDDAPEVNVSYELRGELPEGDAADVLLSLIRQFREPRTEGGVA